MLHLFTMLRTLSSLALWHDLARRFVWLSSLFCAFYVLGCVTVPMGPEPAGERIALDHVRPVCWEAPEAKGSDYFTIPDRDGVAIGISEKDLEAVGLQIEQIGFIYKYAPDAPAANLRLLPLTRPEAWCTNVPRPTDDHVQKLLEVCPAPEAKPQGRGPAATKNLLGQVELPIRSNYFCGQSPRMAPSLQEAILIRTKNLAYLEAYQQARRNGIALTQANADAQWVTSKSDWDLKKLFVEDPGTIEQIQQRLADTLNSIEPPEEYDDPILAMLADKAYKAGFEDGQFEVEAKLFAIDAGIFVIEVVAMEVALGPLGGAKFLASAVSKSGKALSAASARLVDIPIFLPTAAGGLGASVRVGTIIGSISAKAHRYRLEKALKLPPFNRFRQAGESLHHMVAHGDSRAEKTREILDKLKINIDEAVNGVFLPAFKSSPNPKGAIVHSMVHTDAYYAKVHRALRKAKSRKQAIQILGEIRQALENGTFFDAYP